MAEKRVGPNTPVRFTLQAGYLMRRGGRAFTRWVGALSPSLSVANPQLRRFHPVCHSRGCEAAETHFRPTLSAKNFFASATSRLGSSAKALLSVSIAITPDHLDFLISAKRPL